MRLNTPPRIIDIQDEYDSDEPEEVIIAEDLEIDDESDEMEETTWEELQNRLDEGEDDSFDDEYPPEDHSILTFKKHTAPVFSCSWHPEHNWAATGGEDDHVYVWDTENGEVLGEITQHKDTVAAVQFSHDGIYLATGDLAGEMLVHKVTPDQSGKPVLRKIWEYSMGDMNWCRWHRGAHVLLAGSENGEVYVWRLPSGDCKIFPSSGASCEGGQLTNDGKKLLASYKSGKLKLWDIKNCKVIMEAGNIETADNPYGQYEVACDGDSPFYAYAFGDKGEIVFCTNSGPVHDVKVDGTVECLRFSPSQDFKMLACGTLQGQIVIWDCAKYVVRATCDIPPGEDGVLRIQWINDFTLAVCTIGGCIHIYDARTGARKATLYGHKSDIYEMFYNRKETKFLTVSEDGTAKIFNLPELAN